MDTEMRTEFDIVLPPERLRRLQEQPVVVIDHPAVFELAGPGALQCLQGLLTNDVVGPGDDSLIYGALLTPKGMIVVDYWVVRRSDRILMLAPAAGREASLELFRRSLPPRLARVNDRTGEAALAWIVGDGLDRVVRGFPLEAGPQPGRVGCVGGEEGLVLARAPEGAPFQGFVVGPADAVREAAAQMEAAGAAAGDRDDLQAARIVAGWPALGAEIDEKTLPQEVRYDEIGGVSYTKGCYTGQETVARLHFRGHPNRHLRGLVWEQQPVPGPREVLQGDRVVGTVRSTLAVGASAVGLTVLRREVQIGETVLAAGAPARVVSLPFAAADLPS